MRKLAVPIYESTFQSMTLYVSYCDLHQIWWQDDHVANFLLLCFSANQVIDGEVIDVEWSKPVDKTIYNTRKALTKLFSQPAPMPMAPNMHRYIRATQRAKKQSLNGRRRSII